MVVQIHPLAPNMKNKNKTKKLKRKTVSENSLHSDFYTGLNLYLDVNDFNSAYKGQMCYLPDGTMYRKRGWKLEE